MNKRVPIILGLFLICVSIWMIITPEKHVRSFMERLDNLGYDLQLRAYVLTGSVPTPTSVAIVDIDDKSLKAEGQWPWPRGKMGTLVNEMQEQGAVVIAFDILFAEKEENIAEKLASSLPQTTAKDRELSNLLKTMAPKFDQDAIFAKILAANQGVLPFGFLPTDHTHNVLTPPLLVLNTAEEKQLNLIKASGYISNIPVLQQATKGSGFINIFADSDGIIRRVPLLMEYKNGVYPALSLQAVLTYLGEKITLNAPLYHDKRKLESIQIGNSVIPTDEKGQVLIPFIGKSYTFKYYSATDILHHQLPKDALLGKIVFVGTSATGLGDLQTTSIQSPFPGVEIQASIVNGLLQKSNFSFVPAWTLGANIFLTLLFGLLATFIFPFRGPRVLGVIFVMFPPLIFFINNWFWEETGLILSMLMPVVLVQTLAMINIIYGYLFESRKREHLKEMFGQYVPEKHIDEMLHSTGNYGLYGEDRDMSVLFADIRNFTNISEGMSAAELVNMLNTFFTPMTEIIFKHKGTIDKYVGDLIMAFWGAPLKDKNHARHAIESALEMQAKVKEMHTVFEAQNWPAIHIGIGINSGVLSVGDMGSRFRRNYTVMGDNVNLASRVEALTKFYGVTIIVTEYTQHNQTLFIFRKLDRVRVKGKNLSIEIYEVVCKKSKATTELMEELEQYHKALEFYYRQQWDEALALMNDLHHQHPHRKIYSLYQARINEFIENPLPAEWDGVYIHVSK